MRGRKYDQIKSYSRIMKIKRQTGKIEEVPTPKNTGNMMEEDPMKNQPQELLEELEFEEEFEDEFEDEEAWESENEEEEMGVEDDGTMQTEQEAESQAKVE